MSCQARKNCPILEDIAGKTPEPELGQLSVCI